SRISEREEHVGLPGSSRRMGFLTPADRLPRMAENTAAVDRRLREDVCSGVASNVELAEGRSSLGGVLAGRSSRNLDAARSGLEALDNIEFPGLGGWRGGRRRRKHLRG